MKTAAYKIRQNENPSDLFKGLHVYVRATVKKIRGNYVDVEIHDRICGVNIATIKTHHVALFTGSPIIKEK